MPDCCGRSFTSNGMRNHLDNSYNHSNEIGCRWCFARWPIHDGNLRLRHEQQNHWLSCGDCSSIFAFEEDLEEHRDEEHPSNYCYGCERQFSNLHSLNQHLKSSVHIGKNVKCPWCSNMFTNLTGICLHLESGSCSSGINRQKIDRYCKEVDPNHVFTNKQIGWYDDTSDSPSLATNVAWDGSFFRCYLCQNGFHTLAALNQHLGSPAHRQNIYHCPRCQQEYSMLSALVNHLESESCSALRFNGIFSGLAIVQHLRIGQ